MRPINHPAGEAAMPRGQAARSNRLHFGSYADNVRHGIEIKRSFGVTKCPILHYALQGALAGRDPYVVEGELNRHHEWGPQWLTEMLFSAEMVFDNSAFEHGQYIAQMAQVDSLLGLIEDQPFERARQLFCAVLAHKDFRFLSGEAAYLALTYLNAGHPNPRRFLEKPEVRGKFPADLELDRFAAPDFD